MARVEPATLRFVRPDLTGEVPSPPHDALTPEARRSHLRDHPRSYLGVTRAPEDSNGSASVEDLLQEGRAFLQQLLDDDVFGADVGPTYVIYRLEYGSHRQTGLVCLVATEDYETGVVRIHENINQRRAGHLARHLRVVGVQSSPIALAFKTRTDVTDIMARVAASTAPVLDFADDTGLRQQLWVVDDQSDIATIGPAFENEPLYLIDGHHRAAASSEDRRTLNPDRQPGHRMLAALFPYDELRSEAFHRHISAVDPADFERKLADRFPTRVASTAAEVADRAPTELALALPDNDAGHDPDRDPDHDEAEGAPRWCLIDVPYDENDRTGLNNIDPVRLSRNILGPLLDLDESGSDPRLAYRPGPADLSAIEATRVRTGEVLFLMRPIPTTVLMTVSDAGKVMPPKSTYFQPKVRSGLFIRSLD